jgi:hypothetical protein
MLRNGRPEDQGFGDGELLYRRYRREDLVDGKIVDASFRFPRLSVNRSKYSEPEDALFSEDGSFDGLGVLEVRVDVISIRLLDDSGAAFVFYPWHVPLDRNYSHSEVWCDREQARGEQVVPSSTAKKKIRAKISQHAKVRIGAQS